MKKLVLGSLNIDRTYQVATFAQPKETISALGYVCSCGGKGFNQAIAMSRAGSDVHFAGIIGADGDMLWQALIEEKIHGELIRRSRGPNGHAVIQVDQRGQNCIIVVPGSNAEVSCDYIDEVLREFESGDLIVLQNEIPNIGYAIASAHARGMLVAFNPSPCDEITTTRSLLEQVSVLLINEIEGLAITGQNKPEEILRTLHQSYPKMTVVLTLGGSGSMLIDEKGTVVTCIAFPSRVVDTTAAGDTFAGYFLTEYVACSDRASALQLASAAAGIAVSRVGAVASIPRRAEVLSQYPDHSATQTKMRSMQ